MIYVQCSEMINKNLIIKVTYESNVQVFENRKVECTCIKQHNIKLDVVQPFSIEFSTFSMQVRTA
jgi:hypothetical protein